MPSWLDATYAAATMLVWMVAAIVGALALIIAVAAPIVLPLAKRRLRAALLHAIILVSTPFMVFFPLAFLLVIISGDPMTSMLALMAAMLAFCAAWFFVIKRAHDMAPIGWVWIKRIRLPGVN
jgi:Ca2+/Na+ antiporter